MKAAFLDRDGVINIDKKYLYKISDFEYQNGIIELLKFLISEKYELFIITNQSGIGRKMYSYKDMKILHDWLIKDLNYKSIKINSIEYCPHLPEDNCNCRKPKTGMIQNILNNNPKLDLNNSILIGDKLTDIQCGKNIGISMNFLIDSKIDTKKQFKDIILNINLWKN